uniref:Uncharacterized LOC102782100 n=2 Tax=Pseudocrenilabrinae TaxID=318546 RepID=A0A3Q4HE57_NEOBR
MEEAYNELYQQFLRLRSLCLKQAALLQQLTTALQKQKESVKAENKFPLLLPLDSLACHGASYNESRNSKQNHPAGDRTLRTIRMPVMDCCTLINDFQGGSGGAMLSDVALQSHICEFCQAVFPGHTTTRGEFLRHLNTHVT